MFIRIKTNAPVRNSKGWRVRSSSECDVNFEQRGSHLGNKQNNFTTSWLCGYTVDGSEIRRAPVEVGSFSRLSRLSHYLQGFVHRRWLFRISSINSINYFIVLLSGHKISSPPKYVQFQQGFNAFLHFLNLQKPQLPRRETTPRESHWNQKSMLDTGNVWQLQAQQIHEEFTKRWHDYNCTSQDVFKFYSFFNARYFNRFDRQESQERFFGNTLNLSKFRDWIFPFKSFICEVSLISCLL